MYNSNFYININNYNNFLRKLENSNFKNKNNNKNKNKNKNNNNFNKLEIYDISLNNTLKEIEFDFYNNNYNNINFSGLTNWDNNYNNENENENINNLNNYIKQSNPFNILNLDKEKKQIQEIQEKKEITLKENIIINKEINNIDDLLFIINNYPIKREIQYNINVNILHKIKEPLEKLNSMIGMNKLKQNICDQLIFYLQNFNENNNDYLHTIIYGPPGCGKTEIAKIIGQLYSNIGILKKGTFKKVVRADLIAGYLGQTSLKTREVINEALGGVLFIDEAYSLGSGENRDSFSKECIDTLCESLSDNKNNLMVIIAGYENEINECFFKVNKGLISRFNWIFKIENYSAEELKLIFEKKVLENNWNFSEDFNIDLQFYKNNINHFNYFGRSIEIFFSKIKIIHSRRVFCLSENLKKKINNSDFLKGFDLYLSNKNENENEIYNKNKNFLNMYI